MGILNQNFEINAKRTITSIARREIVLQALLVGILAGLFAVIFRYSVTKLDSMLFESSGSFTILQKLMLFPFITAIGGLVAGVLIYKISPDASGSGIPEVKRFLTQFDRKFRVKDSIIKFLAGIVGIGSGITLGREGPSVHLGAGAGMIVSKWFNLKGFKQKNIVAAGAGAAIGATFNAPIAATLFVMEELVHVFRSSLLFPVLIATVTASVLARTMLGNNFAFDVPKITPGVDYQGIPVFIMLGVISGLIGIAFKNSILSNLDLFARHKNIPNWIKPAIAGFFVGLTGIFLPYLLGPGNQAVNDLLNSHFTLIAILLIIIGKFYLTSFCYGSGATGGLFMPTIMLGAFIGYFIGDISHNYAGVNIDPTLISILGMGAFLSAVVRTPITAVVIVFELTGDYNHILPIMLSAGIADFIADRAHSHSIYEILIERKEKQEEKTKIEQLLAETSA